MSSFRDQFESLKKQVDEKEPSPPPSAGRRNTGTASSTPAEAAAVRTWTPRIIHWRSWSPYDSDHSTRLDKKDAEELQRRIDD